MYARIFHNFFQTLFYTAKQNLQFHWNMFQCLKSKISENLDQNWSCSRLKTNWSSQTQPIGQHFREMPKSDCTICSSNTGFEWQTFRCIFQKGTFNWWLTVSELFWNWGVPINTIVKWRYYWISLSAMKPNLCEA